MTPPVLDMSFGDTMHTIFSAHLKSKLVSCTVYWNQSQDWILINEKGDEVASLYHKTLVERMTESMKPADTIQNAKIAEQRINRIMSKQGKRAAEAPLKVVAYFATE